MIVTLAALLIACSSSTPIRGARAENASIGQRASHPSDSAPTQIVRPSDWTRQHFAVVGDLHAIDGAGTYVVAVGEHGHALTYDGVEWTAARIAGAGSLVAVRVHAELGAWAADDEGQVFHSINHTWERDSPEESTWPLTSLAISRDGRLLAVGADGTLFLRSDRWRSQVCERHPFVVAHWTGAVFVAIARDGYACALFDAGWVSTPFVLHAVDDKLPTAWRTRNDGLFFVDPEDPTRLVLNSEVVLQAPVELLAVWGSNAVGLIAVGRSGWLFHYREGLPQTSRRPPR